MNIPLHSSNINPIKKLFNLVRKKLDQDAIERDICFETRADFRSRVIETLYNMDTGIIDGTIASMDKRM